MPNPSSRRRRLHTVFGAVEISSCGYLRCTCRDGKPGVEWPLRYFRLGQSTPELSYILAKWGSAKPYRRAAEMLSEFLPFGDGAVSHATVRRHTLAVGQHLDLRTTEPAEYDWPEPRRTQV